MATNIHYYLLVMQWEDKLYTPERVAALWDTLTADKATFMPRAIPGSNLKELTDYCDLAKCRKIYEGRRLHPDKFMYTYDLNKCDRCDLGYAMHKCTESAMPESSDNFLLRLYTQALVYSKSIDFFKYLVDTDFVPSNWLIEQLLIMCLLPEYAPKDHFIHYMVAPALKDAAVEYLARTYLYLYYDTLPMDLSVELLRRKFKVYMKGAEGTTHRGDMCYSAFIFNAIHRVTADTIDHYGLTRHPKLPTPRGEVNAGYLFVKILRVSDAECRDKLYKYFFEQFGHMYSKELLKSNCPELYALVEHIAVEPIGPTRPDAVLF